MEPYQQCSDMSDLTELSQVQQLYLKPEAKLSITVALPGVRLPGKTISNWEVMERLRAIAEPDGFQVIKVSKSTLEFIRFDGEIENRSQLSAVISRLDGKVIRLSGFPEPLKVRAAEAKPEFPTRHDWDKFFRDSKNMNEMKPGERPDTICLQGLPSKWFVSKRDRRNGSLVPSEFTLQKVFEMFGEIRCVDIPMLDIYRNQMKASISGMRTFSHTTDSTFDAFVQYREYISFVKAMDTLKGMKLVQREAVKAYSASIKVDFDKTKHLSDMSIHRRRTEREKLMAKEREKEEEKRREEQAVKQAVEDEQRKKEEEKTMKGERRKQREEKRKQRILKKLKKKEAEQMNIKIAIEERKLVMAQRKLESIRLLDELFERVKVERQKEITKQKEEDLVNQVSKVKKKKEEKLRKREEKELKKKDKLVAKEKQLRKKLVKKIKMAQEQQMEERRERLRKTMEGKIKMRSVLKSSDGREVVGNPDDGTDGRLYNPIGYPLPYEPYGYNYRDWSVRGGFRGRYFPRRPFRDHRGAYHNYHPYPIWQSINEGEWPEEKKRKSSGADDVEEISSAESSATSKYSRLGSSSNEDQKKETWPEYETAMPPDGPVTHPWGGYSDYFNPRFMRRGRGRSRAFRAGGRGGFGPSLNPNVPTSSFYMKSINEQYYRYFNKLSKGDHDVPNSRSRSRSRSHSSERVVCRKVLSRSKSRSPNHPRSRSRSSSRRSSRSSSRSRSRSSKSYSRSRSRHRSRSRDRRSRSKKRSEEREPKKGHDENRESSPKKKANPSETRGESSCNDRSSGHPENDSQSQRTAVDEKEKKLSSPDKMESNVEVKSALINRERKQTLEQMKTEGHRESKKKAEQNNIDEKEGSELSLSLSGSEGWSSPERKAKPLGNPNWQPTRSYHRESNRDRNNRFASARYRSRYDNHQPQVRSLVTRPGRRSRSRSRSRNRRSRERKSDRDRKNRRSHSRGGESSTNVSHEKRKLDEDKKKSSNIEKASGSSSEDKKSKEIKKKKKHEKKSKKKTSH